MRLSLIAAPLTAAALPPTATAQAPQGDPTAGFCILNKSSALCDAGLAGQQKREGLDLAAEIAKGEKWGTNPITRGEQLECLAAWTAIQNAISGGDKRWPTELTPAVVGSHVSRWEAHVQRAYSGLESSLPSTRQSKFSEFAANVGNARVKDVAQLAGNCKGEPRTEG